MRLHKTKDRLKFSGIHFADTPNAIMLKQFIQQIKFLSLTGYVNGKELILSCDISFKAPEPAGIFYNSVQQLLPGLNDITKFSVPPKAVINNNKVFLTARVNISDAWDLISRVTPDLPQTKENPEDAETE